MDRDYKGKSCKGKSEENLKKFNEYFAQNTGGGNEGYYKQQCEIEEYRKHKKVTELAGTKKHKQLDKMITLYDSSSYIFLLQPVLIYSWM